MPQVASYKLQCIGHLQMKFRLRMYTMNTHESKRLAATYNVHAPIQSRGATQRVTVDKSSMCFVHELCNASNLALSRPSHPGRSVLENCK